MIHLPPLRERVEDIPLLAGHFARPIRPADASPVTFSPSALEILKNYRWQGNVRELENAVCHAVSLCGDVVYPQIFLNDAPSNDLRRTIQTLE